MFAGWACNMPSRCFTFHAMHGFFVTLPSLLYDNLIRQEFIKPSGRLVCQPSLAQCRAFINLVDLLCLHEAFGLAPTGFRAHE